VLLPGARLGMTAEGGAPCLRLERGSAWFDCAGLSFRCADAPIQVEQARFWASLGSPGGQAFWLREAFAGEAAVALGVREGSLRLDLEGNRRVVAGEVAEWIGGEWRVRKETEAERVAWGASPFTRASEAPVLVAAVPLGTGWRLQPVAAGAEAFAHVLWRVPAAPYVLSVTWEAGEGADAGIVWAWKGRSCFWVPIGTQPGSLIQASVAVGEGEAQGFLNGSRVWRVSNPEELSGLLRYDGIGVGVASRGPLRVHAAQGLSMPELEGR